MKLILLKDIKGNEFTMEPNSIVRIKESGNKIFVETKDDYIQIRSCKHVLENAIKNCYLP